MSIGPFSLDPRRDTPLATNRPTSLRRVLIADPDELLLGRLGTAMDEAGYVTQTVPSGRALLETVRRQPTQLLVVASELSDMSAASAIRRMRDICAAPPVVLLATHGADPRHSPLRQDVAACVFKPVKPDEFLGICQRVLRFSERRVDRRTEPRRTIRVDVSVESQELGTLPATLVELSAGGFRLELPSVAPGGTIRVVVPHNGGSQQLTFEGRLQWQQPISSGTLAGGDLLSVGPEDERILRALMHPLG